MESLLLACEFDTAQFLIFSDNVYAPLIYYSHLGPMIASLLIGLMAFIISPKSLVNRILLALTLSFSTWVLFDLVLWASEKPEYIMFFWSMIVPIELLIYVSSFYLVAVFANNRKDIPTNQKLLIFLSFVPILIFSHTNLNLLGFDLSNCDREALEGPLVQYLYFLELFYIFWILKISIPAIKRFQSVEKKQMVLITIGTVSFLVLFSIGNILVSYFLEVDWSYEQYKLFGMPIFVAFLTYCSIKFKTFDLKVITAQALVVTLALLTFSLLFLRSIVSVRIIAAITFFIVNIIGYILIKNVKQEIRQREQLEVLTKDLEKANARLKELDKAKSEFVSIASHQLRSPLTSIRGYASMLAEQSFGKLPQKALEAASRIEESAKLMAMSVEDYLNVSRIESGNMKYNLSDFNIRDMADKLCDDLRPDALKHNLILLFRTDLKSRGIVNADVGKTNQIIHNLINNSIKYTPKGTVNVFMRDDLKKKRIYIDITDTGIGMSQETMHTLFQKFSRADNANSVNVSGTGLGLFVAFKMAEAMGGTITCTSEGDNKGSTFTFELPLAM